ncbi:MAG: glycosyltransferase, partial [Acidimicrobiaceae bacterium]|nr:glycosyltransferase [Acidimicrobiaceae bacterium]
PAADRYLRILVVSASMGAGHDGAARELAARLRLQGHVAEVRDFLDAGPLGVGRMLKRCYEFELRHVPSAYDATYRLWYRVPWLAPALAALVTTLARRKLLRWVKSLDADLVVSTYPLSTLCLGRLRRTGELRVPSVNFITDFGVHPLWVHRGIDLNLAVHAGPARQARLRTGRPSFACGPMVSRAYEGHGVARVEARRRWGLAENAKAVLVVAGSWGVGGIRETFDAIAGDARFTPVVVCGRDEATFRELTRRARRYGNRPIVVGWTEEMPSLMRACDALVENAGGLTSLEAMRVGLPVVSFRPIAGHGVENTTTMAAMGVSRLANDVPELLDALSLLCTTGPARAAQIDAAKAMFVSDAASLALSAAQTVEAADADAPVRSGIRVALRASAAVAGLLGLAWTGLTTGVGVAAAAGAGVAHPEADASNVAYIGVRVDRDELADPATRRELTRLDLTVVVDEQTAQANPAALRRLAAQGVDVANGGRGLVRGADGSIDRPAPWNRAAGDVQAGKQLGRIIGQHVDEFVPGRRLNAFDMVDSGQAHARVIVPDNVWNAAAPPEPGALTGTEIYLVDGLAASPAGLDQVLRRLSGSLTASHLVSVPFSALQ